MDFLCLIPCLIAGAYALDFAGTPVTSPVIGSPLPQTSPPISAPPPPSSSTPVLLFNNIPKQLSTCEPATFNWTYADFSTPQLIISVVTDQSVSTATTAINRVISSTVNPTLNAYTWPEVDVPEGWYKLYAIIPAISFTTTSSEFFVKTGPDISCLLSSNSSAIKSKPVNLGAIVGGILGGAALILSAAIILLLCRRKRLDRAQQSKVIYSEDGKRGRGIPPFFSATRPKKWDNLGSVDSHIDGYGPKSLRYQYRHPVSQSSFTESHNLPVLEYARNPSQKSLDGEEKEKGSPRDSLYKYPPSTDGAVSPRSRRPSEAYSLAASTALSHVTGPPVLPENVPPFYRRPSPSQTMPGSIEANNPVDIPSTHPPASTKSRKATRKPVPVYDPTVDPASSPPPASSLSDTTPLQIADDPFARPMPAAVVHKNSSASLDALGGFNSAASSGHGHYISRSQSHSGMERGLAHKQSLGFEGRPMHYLIPDMPLPQK